VRFFRGPGLCLKQILTGTPARLVRAFVMPRKLFDGLSTPPGKNLAQKKSEKLLQLNK